MTKKEREENFLLFTSEMNKVATAKQKDYATDYDVLSNFKKAASICNLSPEMNALSLIATKVARLGVLLNSEEAPNHESIHDSLIDLANYTIILDLIIKDGK